MPDDRDFILDDIVEAFPRLFEDADLAPLLSLFADERDELLPPGAERLMMEAAR